MAAEPVFLSPLVDQLTGFGQVSTLTILQHLFSSYGVIDKIDPEENSVKMMGPYDPAEPLAWIIEQLEKGRGFVRVGGQTIFEAMIMSKGITPLAQTGIFNDDIREWRRKSPEPKTWAKLKTNFTERIKSRKDQWQPQENGGTPRQCKTSTVHQCPLKKSTTRRSKTYKQSCRECEHKAMSWKDWNKPIQSLPYRTPR